MKNRNKRINKNEQHFRDIWNARNKYTNINIMEVPEGKERERKEQRKIFDKLVAEPSKMC